MSKTAMAAAAVALAASSSALAQQAPQGATAADGVWQRMEVQGRISVADIRRHAGVVLDALDANGNGAISRSELMREKLPRALGKVAEQPQLRRQLFERLDSDGSGQVTREEWNAALSKDLSVADMNEDGTVTLSELARADASTAFFNMLGF